MLDGKGLVLAKIQSEKATTFKDFSHLLDLTLLFLHHTFLIAAIFICLTDVHQLKTDEITNSFYLCSKETSFDIILGASLPQSRIVLPESPSCCCLN